MCSRGGTRHLHSALNGNSFREVTVDDALLIVVSIVTVLSAIVTGATMFILDYLRCIAERLDAMQGREQPRSPN